jgi:hypothetical protein
MGQTSCHVSAGLHEVVVPFLPSVKPGLLADSLFVVVMESWQPKCITTAGEGDKKPSMYRLEVEFQSEVIFS